MDPSPSCFTQRGRKVSAAAAQGTDRVVGALRADPDHVVAELDGPVADHAARSDEPPEAEERSSVVPGFGLLPGRCHEHCPPSVGAAGLNAGSRCSFLTSFTGFITASSSFPARLDEFAQICASAVEP
jgi:hypothetical protein